MIRDIGREKMIREDVLRVLISFPARVFKIEVGLKLFDSLPGVVSQFV